MKNIKLLLLAFIASSSLISCVDDDVRTFSEGSRIVGFKSPSNSYIFTAADTDPVTESEPIDLIGGANGTTSDSPITIKFEVDPSSTAIEGTEFNFENASKEVTILPGQDFTKLEYTIIPTNLTGGLTKSLKINLTQVTTQNGVVSSTKKTMTISIAKCDSNLAGIYDLTVTREDTGFVRNFPSEEITAVPGATGQYITSSTAVYAVGVITGAGGSRDGFEFSDICQSISIPEQAFGNEPGFGITLIGNEGINTVTLDSGGQVTSITMHYTLSGFTAGAAVRNYTAEYTKL
jgi:hypothetical protein